MVRRDMGKDALILGTSRRPRPDREGNVVEVIAALPDRAEADAGTARTGSYGAVEKVAPQRAAAREIEMTRELDTGIVEELRAIQKRLEEILVGLGQHAPAALEAAGPRPVGKASPILRERLLGAGFYPSLIDSKGEFLATARNMSLEALVRSLVKEIEPKEPVEDVSVFIGPSGAGKTTTVLKIATGMLLPNDAKPLIVYFGSDSDGAKWLQSQCKKLHIRFKYVSNIKDMGKMLAKRSEFPILIDTPGISALTEEELRFFVEAARETEGMNIRLVVDSGMDPLNICAIASCLPDTSKVSLVLTKMDEATRIGGAVSAAIGSSLHVSYVTGGSEVADGIFIADSDILLDKLIDGMAAANA